MYFVHWLISGLAREGLYHAQPAGCKRTIKMLRSRGSEYKKTVNEHDVDVSWV